MNVNQFKAGFFRNPQDLHRHRLAVTQKQLTEFWFSKTLIQLQQILCIKDQYLIYNMIFQQYLLFYLNNKKIASGEVFQVIHKQQVIGCIYDAKIFRSQSFEKAQNDLISTFLIGYKSNQAIPQQQIFQFLSNDLFTAQEWLLKIKQSALLRIFPYLMLRLLQKKQSFNNFAIKNPIGGYYYSQQPDKLREVVILHQSSYYHYAYLLVPQYGIGPETTVKKLFEILADLMFNNLLIAWYKELSQMQKYERHFQKYFRLMLKPKNKQEFTSIQNKFTQIKWQTLSIFVFKLKYNIKQTETYYECYQIEQKQQQNVNQPYQQLQKDDINILKAFQKRRISSPNYDQEYTLFFDNLQN